MNAITCAIKSLRKSVGAACDFFLVKGEEVANQIKVRINHCIDNFNLSSNRVYRGTEDLVEGVTGMLCASTTLVVTVAAIPLLWVAGTLLAILGVITHTIAVPMTYVWVFYESVKEAFSKPQESINYFPEVEVLEPATAISSSVIAMGAFTLMAMTGIEMELEPAIDDWTPSYIPAVVQKESEVEQLDLKTFRQGLERQFAAKSRQTLEEYILRNLPVPVTEQGQETMLTYPQCEINPDLAIEVAQGYAVRETVSPFPVILDATPASATLESPLVKAKDKKKFPRKPSNRAMQKWTIKEAIGHCDRINKVEAKSIAEYKNATDKELVVAKIKSFYASIA
jgi:hypothetical protein